MSFVQPSSSLQRATKQGRDANKTVVSSPSQRRSSFETCFASGLDLSEFGATKKSSVSNAAILLQIKQHEAEVKQQQEREECRLQHAVQKRIQAVQQERTECRHNKQNLYRALGASPTTVWSNSARPTSLQKASKLASSNKSNVRGDLVGAIVGMMHQDDETTTKQTTLRRNRTKNKSFSKTKLGQTPKCKKSVIVKKARKYKH